MNAPLNTAKTAPSRQRLMATTPMRDWIRGRLTGRLDYSRLIEEAAFPGAITNLINDVLRRTRLWRLEKAEVARELIAHFRDGLAAGADPARLAADFGSPAQAAKLIRRAKKRNRPWAWRAMIKARNAAALLLVSVVALYALLALRYFSGRPTVSRDYLAELNAPAHAVPEADRAWPLYREAFFKLTTRPEELNRVDWTYVDIPDNDPRKALYADYLRASSPALDIAALAAQKPHMGYIMTHEPDNELQAQQDKIWGIHASTPLPAPQDMPQLIEVLLPSLGRFRGFARLAHADCELAAAEGDRARVVRDINIMMGITSHSFDNQFLISQLVGVSLISFTSETIDILLRDHPSLLSDEDLIAIAHRLAAIQPGGVRISLAGEQAMFDDAIQRMYTDNGNGNGRLAGRSPRDLRSFMKFALYPWPDNKNARDLAGPLVMTASASRAELTRVHRAMLGQAASFAQTPVWERTNSPVVDAIVKYESDPIARTRYWPVIALLPALDHAQANADRAGQQRDATLTSLAIEIYRRRHNKLPATLADLTPDLLPAIPRDQFDGLPLKYSVTKDSYVLYSIGVDRKDDGGRQPNGHNPLVSNWTSPARIAALLKEPGHAARYDGDWVLFPPGRSHVDPPPKPEPKTEQPAG